MKSLVVLMCALSQFVTAQSGSVGTLVGTKKQDVKQLSLFNGGGSVVIGGEKKKKEASTAIVLSIESGNPIIRGGSGKKADFSSDTGGGSTSVGGTVDTLGKKKDLASQGEPIKIGKKQDFGFSDSGGNGAVIGTGSIKRDYCESGGTGVSSGSSTGNLGKKNDFRHS